MLGHAQQGGNPAPFDRNMGTKLAANALEFILTQAKKYTDPASGITNATATDSATLLGLKVIIYSQVIRRKLSSNLANICCYKVKLYSRIEEWCLHQLKNWLKKPILSIVYQKISGG